MGETRTFSLYLGTRVGLVSGTPFPADDLPVGTCCASGDISSPALFFLPLTKNMLMFGVVGFVCLFFFGV